MGGRVNEKDNEVTTVGSAIDFNACMRWEEGQGSTKQDGDCIVGADGTCC